MSFYERFNEGNFEEVIIELLKEQGYEYIHGSEIHRQVSDTILIDDLFQALYMINYNNGITEEEINEIIKQLISFNTTNLYEINKFIYNILLNGIKVERNNEDENDFIAKIIDFDN